MKFLIYIFTIVLSCLILFFGHIYINNLRQNFHANMEEEIIDYVPNYRARVLDIIFTDEIVTILSSSQDYENEEELYTITTEIYFLALVEDTNDEIIAIQTLTDMNIMPSREVSQGDTVLLQFNEANGIYELVGFVRIHYLIIFIAIMFILMLFFGKMQGFNSIISLALTIAAIFLVFIPAILYGANIYLWSILVSVYSTVTTLFIVIGFKKKTVVALISCLLSIGITSVLLIIMNYFIGLTGISGVETADLLTFNENIDVLAIIFAGIIIGSIGAIMDVSISISSALWELRQAGKNSFKEIYNSGVQIGKDILGTMSNTLVLAYIGSYLTVVLVLIIRFVSVLDIFHHEMIVTEILRAVIGVAGIFLTIPISTIVSSFVYSSLDNKEFS
ncbi:MAG: YibE/F family protein [Defluviitaleaceae bacterium]|nr:YibE/F family protein [Defluviitaleaceae bacterium]